MKKVSLKAIMIAGAIFMIVAGSLLHFTYEWSGNNQLVALFSATSESVWEHNKLFLLPLFIVTIIEYKKVKNLSKILWVSLIQLVFMICFVIILFYTYTGALGIENVIIDILLFMIAVIIGQVLAYRQLVSKSKPAVNKYITGAALIVISYTFVVITFLPPKLPIFTPHSLATSSNR